MEKMKDSEFISSHDEPSVKRWSDGLQASNNSDNNGEIKSSGTENTGVIFNVIFMYINVYLM